MRRTLALVALLLAGCSSSSLTVLGEARGGTGLGWDGPRWGGQVEVRSDPNNSLQLVGEIGAQVGEKLCCGETRVYTGEVGLEYDFRRIVTRIGYSFADAHYTELGVIKSRSSPVVGLGYRWEDFEALLRYTPPAGIDDVDTMHLRLRGWQDSLVYGLGITWATYQQPGHAKRDGWSAGPVFGWRWGR